MKGTGEVHEWSTRGTQKDAAATRCQTAYLKRLESGGLVSQIIAGERTSDLPHQPLERPGGNLGN